MFDPCGVWFMHAVERVDAVWGWALDRSRASGRRRQNYRGIHGVSGASRAAKRNRSGAASPQDFRCRTGENGWCSVGASRSGDQVVLASRRPAARQRGRRILESQRQLARRVCPAHVRGTSVFGTRRWRVRLSGRTSATHRRATSSESWRKSRRLVRGSLAVQLVNERPRTSRTGDASRSLRTLALVLRSRRASLQCSPSH